MMDKKYPTTSKALYPVEQANNRNNLTFRFTLHYNAYARFSKETGLKKKIHRCHRQTIAHRVFSFRLTNYLFFSYWKRLSPL